MRVRAATVNDLPRLRQIHQAQGLGYELPDFNGGDILGVEVVVDEHDQAVMAVIARQTCELYLLQDQGWSSPGIRWEALKACAGVMGERLKDAGITDSHIWLPPAVENFGRRLERDLGWKRNSWSNYWRMVN